MSIIPLVPGETGWLEAIQPPPFDPVDAFSGDFAHRRWPSAIRLLGKDALHYLNAIPELEIAKSLRVLTSEERRRTIGFEPIVVKEGDYTAYIEDWVCAEKNRLLARWWKSHDGWRSPREYVGYRRVEEQHKLLRFEPFEVAVFRLPDDIAMDEDVVLFQAWCQGVQAEHVLHLYRPGEHKERIRRGQVRFQQSPWVIFATACHLMEPTGILFGAHGYLESCRRLETLLRQPYTATTGELEVIFRAPSFLAARARAKGLRKSGTYWNPPGSWYYGSRPSFLSMRRGGEWTTTGRSKRSMAAKRHIE